MSIATAGYWKAVKSQLKDPLYTNSLYIFSTRVLTVVSGFIFWMIAAKLYSVEEVGLAVALISSAGIVSMIAGLGFEHSIIRFVTRFEAAKIINSSIAIIAVSSTVVGTCYCLVAMLLPSSSSLIRDLPFGPVAFVLFCVVSSIAVLTGNALLATRKPREYLAQNILISTRLLILLPLVFLGSYGIFGSALAAQIIALAAMWYVIGRSMKLNLKVDREYVYSSLRYSAGNYIANLFINLPALLLSIIVLSVLGEASAAVFYVACTIGNFLPEMTFVLSTALFIEGSHGKGMKKNVIKTLLTAYALLVPGFLAFVLLGDRVLSIYGSAYTQGFDLMILFAFSSFFTTIYYVFYTIQKVNMGIRSLVKLNGLLFVIMITLSYLLMKQMGITGIGYAVIACFIFMDLIVIVKARKERWI